MPAAMEPAFEAPAEAITEVSMKAVKMAEAIAAVETAETVGEEDRPAGEERGREEPWVAPIVGGRIVGIGGRRINRPRRRRIGLRGRTGRVLADSPTAARLLA